MNLGNLQNCSCQISNRVIFKQTLNNILLKLKNETTFIMPMWLQQALSCMNTTIVAILYSSNAKPNSLGVVVPFLIASCITRHLLMNLTQYVGFSHFF